MSGPLELTAVGDDDELLDRIGQGGSLHDDDDAVAEMLFGWRADIVDDADDRWAAAARAASPAALHPPRVRPYARRPSLRSAAAAAAMIGVLSSLAVAAAASQASPDSVLFPLTRVVASQHAESVQARDDVRAALQRAQAQADAGHRVAARKTLRAAQLRTADIRPDDGRAALRAQVDRALARLAVPAPPAVRPSALPAPTPEPSSAPTPPRPSAPLPEKSAPSSPTPQASPSPVRTPDAAAIDPAAPRAMRLLPTR